MYPLFIKRSKTKAAQIISVVFKWFNNSLLAISILGRGNIKGRDARLRSRSKAEVKENALTFWHLNEMSTGDFYASSAPFENCYTKEIIFLKSFPFQVPLNELFITIHYRKNFTFFKESYQENSIWAKTKLSAKKTPAQLWIYSDVLTWCQVTRFGSPHGEGGGVTACPRC